MTRKQLIEFLSECQKFGDIKYLADALIKEGFVKVDEPMEFYVFEDDHGRVFASNDSSFIDYRGDPPVKPIKIFHVGFTVREVVEE